MSESADSPANWAEGYCKFEGRVIPLAEVPERAWPMEVFDNNGRRTGQTVGDLVRIARLTPAAATDTRHGMSIDDLKSRANFQ